MARLIDADALIHSICHRCNDVNYDEPCEPSDCAFYYAIHNAPTVGAVEVVHGRWEEWYPPAHMILTGEEMLYRCSACTAKYPDVEGFNYCPYCGVVMENKYHESTD